ncbi:MAG: ribonuclease Z [Bacteroidota bacterium]
MLALTILGNNSAVPAFDRHPTSQVLTHNGNNYLIDCGEGTQIQLQRYKIRRGKISHIFISHLHGDHYFGLIGLLNSLSLLGHVQPIHLFAPAPLQEIIDIQLKVSDTTLNFELHFQTIDRATTLVETDFIRIKCFPTDHRIPCFGFSFEEKRVPRNLIIEKVKAAGIPTNFYERLVRGEDYLNKSGERIPVESVTEPMPPGPTYAYCADTRYNESLIEYIRGFDLIYHESTYLHALAERANERYHSTSIQAAELAKKAGVKKLLLGHFSSKYAALDEFEEEARTVFPTSEVALEGICYPIR